MHETYLVPPLIYPDDLIFRGPVGDLAWELVRIRLAGGVFESHGEVCLRIIELEVVEFNCIVVCPEKLCALRGYRCLLLLSLEAVSRKLE
jgi:hypothetical protein